MEISRRTFLGRTAALVGAVGAASMSGSATLGAAIVPSSAAADLTLAEVDALDVPMMLTITDASNAQFELLVGESSFSFTDRALAGRLAKTASGHVVAS